MKKKLRLLAAVGMLSMLISFVACDMQTEDQLLGTTATKEGEEKGNSSGGSKGSSGKKSPLWSKFDGADMQVWVTEGEKKPTATLAEKSDCLEIKIGREGWWGMCFCNKADIGVASPDCVTFNMSNIAKITFEAKASESASMLAAQSDNNSDPQNKTKIDLSTEFEEKEYNLSNPGSRDYGVLVFIGEPNSGTTTKTNVVISVKNIKFFDANGNETAPSRNE